MSTSVKSKSKEELQDIIHHLMIKGASTKNVGLLDGKMGVVIVFYKLGRKYNNEVYTMYADDLLDKVFEDIHVKTPLDFESGLVGIGWGLEYLIQNKYVEADSLDVCEVIDSQLMNLDIRRIQDYSLEKGLNGILQYVLGHINNCISQKSKLPFDTMYLEDLYRKVKQLKTDDKIDLNLLTLFDAYLSFYETKELGYQLSLSNIEEPMQNFDSEKLLTYPIGIRKGLVSHLRNNYL